MGKKILKGDLQSYIGGIIQTYLLSLANIVIAVLKSINNRRVGAKKFPLLSKQENTHYNHYGCKGKCFS